LVLVGVDLGLLNGAGFTGSSGSGTEGRVPLPSQSNPAKGAGPRYFDIPSGGVAPGAAGRAESGTNAVAPSVVRLTGTAALPTASVHPGFGTPEDAVDGFYQSLLNGSPTRACAYVTTPCPSFGSGHITGTVTIVAAVSDRRDALVQVTGTICRSAACTSLADQVLMPTGSASFGKSWASLTSGVYGWAASPLPCVQDPATGQWHVKLS
jgi:hypothetical protein